MTQAGILLLSDQESLHQQFERACVKLGESYSACETVDDCLALVEAKSYKLIYIDLDQDEIKALQLLEWLQTRGLEARIGLLSQKGYTQEFLQGMRLGAKELLGGYKGDEELLFGRLASGLEVAKRVAAGQHYAFDDANGKSWEWVGGDSESRLSLLQAQEMSGLLCPVKICGGRGVGKRLLAFIVSQGHDSLLEMDAHEMAAFEQKEAIDSWVKNLGSNKGCLIIHGIEVLSESLQEFLAEYLKSGCIERDGVEFAGEFQLVVTTVVEVGLAVADESFRGDLDLILSQNVIRLSSLKSRPGDVPLLVQGIVKSAEEDVNRYFSKDALAALACYDWPGNGDELQGVVLEVLKSTTDVMISSKKLPSHILEQSFYRTTQDEEDLTDFTYNEAKKRVLNKFNHDYIDELIKKSGHNLTVAAEQAGMDRSNFKKIIKKFGLKP